jgi:demethylmenaquinone methyltransferase/2-methoxy-6-polyprenyl-1,4-benzoquinol methylase
MGDVALPPQVVDKSRYSGNIAGLYNRLAWMYDFFTDHEPAHHREALQVAQIKPDDSVLEVACGTGRATVEIASRIGEKGRFCAIDLSEKMLQRAENKLRKRNLLDRVELRVGDARQLGFPGEAFDIVYNAYMLDLIDAGEIPSVLAEFRRVLKPGGKLVLIDMSKDKEGKTLYESLYEAGLLSFASGSCRPVLMKPYVEQVGFEKVERTYRKNRSWFFLNWLTGTEIVMGYKPT